MKRTITTLFTFLVCLLAPVAIHAEGTGQFEVAADVIDYDSAGGIVTARGNVSINRGNAVMTGQNALYNTKSQEAELTGGVKVVQEGTDITAAVVHSYNNERISASGDVLLIKGENTLTSEVVDYYPDREYAFVPGNAKLVTADAVLTSSAMEAYLAENRVIATGNVHIVSDKHDIDSTSDEAVYYGEKDGQGRIVLNGNARAVQQGNVLTGAQLTIRLGDKAMEAQGRTKLVIEEH